jgi:hypothetical protein
MGDIANDVEYGRMVVQEGGLKVLRELLGLTRNAMADMLYVSTQTYTNWEIWPEVHLHPRNAGYIGRFYRAAMFQVEYLIEDGVNPKDIRPLHEYAVQVGTPLEVLHRKYKSGALECLDLGILGLWVKR